MAPKKKTIAAVGLSEAAPPVPARTGDVADAGGRGDQDHPRHPDTRSQASDVVCSCNDDLCSNKKLSHTKTLSDIPFCKAIFLEGSRFLYGKPTHEETLPLLAAPLFCFKSAQQLKWLRQERQGGLSGSNTPKQAAKDLSFKAPTARVNAPKNLSN